MLERAPGPSPRVGRRLSGDARARVGNITARRRLGLETSDATSAGNT